MPPLFVGDATTAALNSHQIRKGGHLGYLTSEQSAMDSMFGGFEAKDKKPNMATILGAWSGDYAAVARVQRESFTAKGHGAMCVFSQAGTIDTIHRHSGNQGLIERFLCKSEKGFVGSRDFSKREAIKQDWFDIWRKVCESLFERVKAQLDHDRKKLFAKLGGESPVNNVELAQNEPDAFTNAAPDDVEESSPYSHKPKGVNVSKRTGDKLLLEDIEVNMPPFTNNQPVRLTEWQWNDLRAYRQELEPHLHVEHGKYGADGVRGFGMKMETHVVKIAVTLDLFDISMNKKQAQARDYVEQDNYIAAKAIFATLLDEMTNMLESKGLKKNPPHEEVVIDLIIRRTADNKDCDESILVNSLIGPIKTKTGVLMGKPAIRKLLRSMVESGKLTKDSDSDYQIVDC